MDTQSDEQLLSRLYLHASNAKLNGGDVSLVATNPLGPIQFIKGNRKILISPRNWFYVDDLLNSFDFFFSNVLPKEEDGFLVADFSKPGWHRTPEGDDFYYTSSPEGDQTPLFAEYLRPRLGEIALDLGAYCGRSAIVLAKMVGAQGQVLSYEADPRNYDALVKNVGSGRHPNITAVNKAVWAVPQSLWFSSEANMGSHVIMNPSDNRDDLVEVTGTSLQGILDEHGLERFDIVKLDVEGAEYGILEGSLDLVARVKARWLIEVHADVNGGPLDIDRIRRIMESCGYMTLQLPPQHQIGVYCEPRVR